MSLPSSPNNRKEVYLSNIAGQGTALPTAPQDREEMYLDYIAKNGGGGGGTGDGDMKKSIYDSDLAVASAGGIKSYVSGAIADKVDKVQGKGLSTNDYDDTAKEIVDGVSTALDGKVSKSNTAGLLKNDGTVDTTTYATSTSVSAILDGTTIDSFSDVESALADKAAASDVSTIQGLIPSSATTSNKLATASDIQEIEGNPSGSATAGDLTKLKIDNDIFSIPSGGSSGTTVVPNPSGTATADLNKVQIGTDIYSIPQTDISGKADKVSSPTSGDFASLDSNGNLTDSGKKASDFASSAIMDGQSIDSFGDVESALDEKFPRSEQAVLGTVNIFAPKTQTVSQASQFIVDSEEYISHPQNDYNDIRMWNYSLSNIFITIPKGSWKVSAFQKTAYSTGGQGFLIMKSDDTKIVETYNLANLVATPITFTLSADTTVGIMYKLGDSKFAFMITPSDAPTGSHILSAMTNRELTEDVAKLSFYLESSTKTTSSGVDTFTFTDSAIVSTDVIDYDFSANVFGVYPSDVVITTGQALVKFNSIDNVTKCRLYIKNY